MCVYIYIYIYIYVCVCVCVYMNNCIPTLNFSVFLHLHVYTELLYKALVLTYCNYEI